jgi:hypothetical protein
MRTIKLVIEIYYYRNGKRIRMAYGKIRRPFFGEYFNISNDKRKKKILNKTYAKYAFKSMYDLDHEYCINSFFMSETDIPIHRFMKKGEEKITIKTRKFKNRNSEKELTNEMMTEDFIINYCEVSESFINYWREKRKEKFVILHRKFIEYLEELFSYNKGNFEDYDEAIDAKVKYLLSLDLEATI